MLPQVRLYERASTTALNAYVRPALDKYLNSLQTRLAENGFAGTLLIMQSNGGVTTPEGASRHAVNTLLSGPAAGPVSGLAAAGELGINEIITIDMGGTSFDACLVANGEPQLTSESELAGHFIATPSLDIRVIGAGGGSIASVDAGGVLHVGPASAGAAPGPACYGRGGPATVTDADLLLGYLDAEYFHGGELRLEVSAAESAMEPVARALGMSLQDAAAGVYEVVNANMANALRIVSMQRGYDPREFALVVAGGAGPIHAAALAAELEIPLTLIPRDASVFCAVGMLLTELKHDLVRTFAAPTDELDDSALNAPLGAMRNRAVETLRSEGVAEENVEIRFSADMRYIGQFNEVEVPLKSQISVEQLVADFHRQHNRQFGYSLPGSPTETVNLRARSRGRIRKPELTHVAGTAAPDDAQKSTRAAWFAGEEFETSIYDVLSLAPGSQIDGPAIFEQPTTTIVVPPEFRLMSRRTRFSSFARVTIWRPRSPPRMSTSSRQTDAIRAVVIANRLSAITREMGETMLRTSRSPIFSEARDFVAAIFDHRVAWVANAGYIPVIAGTTPFSQRAIAEDFADDVHEGDVFVLNDPYRGNNHPPDIAVTKPVFYEGKLRFWAMAKGHNADAGGRGVVGYNPQARDCWEDAVRIPPVKLYERGRYRRDVWDMILLNLRIPFS